MPEVYMRCVTWTRDSNGLFDYESKNISKRNIKSVTGGRLVRVEEDVQLIAKDNRSTMNSSTRMLMVSRGADGASFSIVNDSQGANNMFVVVRNTNSNQSNADYRVQAGDVIKLGRVKFKVKVVNLNGQACQDAHNHEHAEPDSDENEVIKTVRYDEDAHVGHSHEEKVPCKFCWMTESTLQNPLLSACQCDGSMRVIHFDCLKMWIKEKMLRKESEVEGAGHVFTYSWRLFECEICKHAYPLTFKSRHDESCTYDLVDELVKADLPGGSQPYMLMQSLPFEKSSGRVIHLIRPDQTAEVQPLFKMGRGHESQVRICDISVSRVHTLIKYQRPTDGKPGAFLLEDNLSKFGTLVLPRRKQIDISENETKALQLGRSVVSFTVKMVEKELPQQH